MGRKYIHQIESKFVMYGDEGGGVYTVRDTKSYNKLTTLSLRIENCNHLMYLSGITTLVKYSRQWLISFSWQFTHAADAPLHISWPWVTVWHMAVRALDWTDPDKRTLWVRFMDLREWTSLFLIPGSLYRGWSKTWNLIRCCEWRMWTCIKIYRGPTSLGRTSKDAGYGGAFNCGEQKERWIWLECTVTSYNQGES